MLKIQRIFNWPVTCRNTPNWEFIGAYSVKGDDFLPCIVLWHKIRSGNSIENRFSRFDQEECYTSFGEFNVELNFIEGVSSEICNTIEALELSHKL